MNSPEMYHKDSMDATISRMELKVDLLIALLQKDVSEIRIDVDDLKTKSQFSLGWYAGVTSLISAIFVALDIGIQYFIFRKT